jgi:hypothetical protein
MEKNCDQNGLLHWVISIVSKDIWLNEVCETHAVSIFAFVTVIEQVLLLSDTYN